MNEHGYCPHCHADLDGGLIPQDIAHHYSGQRWGRALGIQVQGQYDGILIWKCPDCKRFWPRFSRETWGSMHVKALRIIEEWEEKGY